MWYKSSVVQVLLSFGGPYVGFKNLEDRKEDQLELFEEWALEYLGPLLANATVDNERLSWAFAGDGVTDLIAIVNDDAMFALGASESVRCTGSAFLSHAQCDSYVGVRAGVCSHPLGVPCKHGHGAHPALVSDGLLSLSRCPSTKGSRHDARPVTVHCVGYRCRRYLHFLRHFCASESLSAAYCA